MRTRLLPLALACALSCATPRVVNAPLPAPAPTVEEAVTPPRPLLRPAPMQSVLQPGADQPIVTLRLLFHAGAVDDPPGKEGLTALTVALLSQGGTKDLSAPELLRALYPMAAELSADAGRELTVFHGRVHKDHLARFFPIFTQVLTAPRLDPHEFERLKEDALNEIRTGLRGMSDEALGKAALQSVMYQGHPYRAPEEGTVAGLSSITLEDVKAQWKRVFTQDRLVVGLAGAVDGELELKLKSALSALPATGAPIPVIPAPPDAAGHVLILSKPEAISTAISLGHPYGLRRGDADFFPVAFALSYLGEHRQQHGLLFRELREKRGLNYGDYAYAEHFEQQPGSTYPATDLLQSQEDFTIWIRPVEPSRAQYAVRAALYFLQRLVREPIPVAEFQRARGFLMGYTRMWEQTDADRLGYALDSLFSGVPHSLDAYRAALAEMTPESVQAAVARNLKPGRLSLAFVAPDADTLAQSLKIQTPLTLNAALPEDVLKADRDIDTLHVPVNPRAVRVEPSTEFMEH